MSPNPTKGMTSWVFPIENGISPFANGYQDCRILTYQIIHLQMGLANGYIYMYDHGL